MWNNEDEVNEYGEPVKLYLPVQGPPRRNNTDFADSHVGGHATSVEGKLACAQCQDPMYLMVQLRLTKASKSDGSLVDRSLCVFGCPKAQCFATLKFDNGFSSPRDEGVMYCKTTETSVADKKTAPLVPVAPVKSSWYADGDEDDGDNDWGVESSGGNADDDMANMESALAAICAMESKIDEDGTKPKSKQKKPAKPSKPSNSQSSLGPGFDCYLLTHQNEPLPAPGQQAMEEDDVGLSASDDKIRNMLARYMAEEEDQDILSVLKGTTIGGKGIGEEDERLSDKDRLLLGFQDRLRRASRQVVRYARGGVPLWSIPSESSGEPLWNVSPCSCGAKRIFECQLLPSLLHVLQVDKHSGASESGIGNLMSTGMNWGSVAVFTCPDSCDQNKEVLVIQKSVDEQPDGYNGCG
jgi:pre-rRNA-processing protein TSR4